MHLCPLPKLIHSFKISGSDDAVVFAESAVPKDLITVRRHIDQINGASRPNYEVRIRVYDSVIAPASPVVPLTIVLSVRQQRLLSSLARARVLQ